MRRETVLIVIIDVWTPIKNATILSSKRDANVHLRRGRTGRIVERKDAEEEAGLHHHFDRQCYPCH